MSVKNAVNKWLTRWAPTWWEEETKAGWPHYQPADEAFSRYHGLIGALIVFFAKLWSHESKYVGGGKVAEATTPAGGVNDLGKYMDLKHTLEVWRYPDSVVAPHAKDRLCKQAAGVVGVPYDYANLVTQMIDATMNWLVGWRPFAQHIKDRNGASRSECSEWHGWTWWLTFGVAFLPGNPPGFDAAGNKKPADLLHSWLPAVKAGKETPAQNYARMKELGAFLVFKQVRGRVKYVLGED